MATWPPVGAEPTLNGYSAAVPPEIAAATFRPEPPLARRMEEALHVAAVLDVEARDNPGRWARFLARVDAVASSRIEGVTPDPAPLALATVGRPTTSGAGVVAAATRATLALAAGPFEEATLLAAHRVLMAGALPPGQAGAWREAQNWIGHPGAGLHAAAYVPPVPERVPALMADLYEFLRRGDVPVLALAAIGHAQFEASTRSRTGMAGPGGPSSRRHSTRTASRRTSSHPRPPPSPPSLGATLMR